MLGVVVPVLSDIVMAILATAIEEASRELGYLSAVIATHGDPDVRSAAIDHLLSRKVDGFVLCDTEVGRAIPAQLESESVPFVFAMRRSDSAISVTADDRRGGSLVAEHFVAMGHKRVAVVPGPASASTSLDRVAGFAEVMAEHTEITVVSVSSLGGFGVEDGHRYVTELLEQHQEPPLLCFARTTTQRSEQAGHLPTAACRSERTSRSSDTTTFRRRLTSKRPSVVSARI